MVAPADKKGAEPAKDAAPADQDQQPVFIEEEDAFEEFAAQQTGAFSFQLMSSRDDVLSSRARALGRPPSSCPASRRARCSWASRLARRAYARVLMPTHAESSRRRRRRFAHTRPPPSATPQTTTVTNEAVVEEEANEALWQADWDDEDTSADFQTRLKAELARVAAK